jgi:FkbM family methyltransferase
MANMGLVQELKNLKSRLATSANLPFLYRHHSYSQEGEDRIIAKTFSHLQNGFFVDIGAYHPFRFSNTQLLYEIGWHGINVEPTPGAVNAFKLSRKRDINLSLAVGEQKTISMFYCFADPALNTFNSRRAETIVNSRQSRLIAQYKLPTYRLDEILTEYLPKNQVIHFMNIDVEGLELSVVNSNDWQKFLPLVIAIENFHYLPELTELDKYGYLTFAQTYSTQILKLKNVNF